MSNPETPNLGPGFPPSDDYRNAKKGTEKPHAIVGAGTAEERQIGIVDATRVFIKGREVSVCELEGDEGFILMVENLPTTGRHPVSQVWLSRDSLVALMAAVTIQLESGIGIAQETSRLFSMQDVHYTKLKID